MKNIPLYEVEPIQDLRDMLNKLAKFNEDVAFLVKDPFVLEAEKRAAAKQNKEYIPVTFKKYIADVKAFGAWLTKNLAVGSKVAILAETRYEWYVSYMATVNGFGIVVPFDKELTTGEIGNLLERFGVDALVCSSKQKERIESALLAYSQPLKLILMQDTDETLEADEVNFWDCLTEGEKIFTEDKSYEKLPIDPNEMRVLLSTSGTTNKSKAVMLSHKAICTNLMAMCKMIDIKREDVFLSVLPIHHTYECTCGFLCPIYRGATVAICEGLRHIVDNAKEAKATVLLVVPLMLEAFHKRIKKGALADPKTARAFKLGLGISKFLYAIGIDKRREIFHKIHETFGGKLRLLISGGAAIDAKVLQEMSQFGFLAIQGYGLTECSPILAVNRDCDYKDYSAGLPLQGVEIKISNPDEDGIGEILGRGDNLMLGYYQDEELTAQVFDEEGFYRTGDFGKIDKDGFIVISGRKANIIVTKNGKNIFPEEIEFLLKQETELIQEVVVSSEYNDHDDLQIHAEIFPNLEVIEIETGKKDLTDEELIELFEPIVKEVNHKMPTYKYIKKIGIRHEEFPKNTGRKIKRYKETKSV